MRLVAETAVNKADRIVRWRFIWSPPTQARQNDKSVTLTRDLNCGREILAGNDNVARPSPPPKIDGFPALPHRYKSTMRPSIIKQQIA
jgi:hypothetical protein